MKRPENSIEVDVDQSNENWMEVVRKHVRSLRFGVVQIVIHDARVVQIEKTEKIRFEQKSDA